jgi:zinc transport system ATP-binding protein
MISHDVTTAIEYSSHILHIGKTVFYGTKEEYIKNASKDMFGETERGDRS